MQEDSKLSNKFSKNGILKVDSGFNNTPKSPDNENKVTRFRETPDVIGRVETESATKRTESKPATPSTSSCIVSNFSISTLTSSKISKQAPHRLRYNQLFNDSNPD